MVGFTQSAATPALSNAGLDVSVVTAQSGPTGRHSHRARPGWWDPGEEGDHRDDHRVRWWTHPDTDADTHADAD